MNNYLTRSLHATASVQGESGSYYTLEIEDGDLTERYHTSEDDVREQTMITSDLPPNGSATYLYDAGYLKPQQRLVYYIDEDGNINEAEYDEESEEWSSQPITLNDVVLAEGTKLAAVYTVDDDSNNLFFQDKDGAIRLARRSTSDREATWDLVPAEAVQLKAEVAAPIAVSVIDKKDSYYFLISTVRTDGSIVEMKYNPFDDSRDVTSFGNNTISGVTTLLSVTGVDGTTAGIFIKTQAGLVYTISFTDGNWETKHMGSIDEDGKFIEKDAAQAFMDLPTKLVQGLKTGYKEYKEEKAARKNEEAVKAARKKLDDAMRAAYGPCY